MCIQQQSFYKWSNTPCRWTYKWEQIYKTCWFEFWQHSDLTRGLVECPVLSYRTIQEAEYFFDKIYGKTPTVFVNGMSVENFAATRDAIFSQGTLSQTDSSMMTSQISAPKIYHGLKPRDGWWKILFCSQTLIAVSFSKRLSGTDHMHWNYWL